MSTLNVFNDMRRGMHHVACVLKEATGLSISEFTVLECIGCNPGCLQKDIAEAAHMDPDTIGAIVKRFDEWGWVARGNGQFVRALSLTESGKAAFSEARHGAVLVEQAVINVIDVPLASVSSFFVRLAEAAARRTDAKAAA
jgi:DNA-binding MarR family transcriptional regulator